MTAQANALSTEVSRNSAAALAVALDCVPVPTFILATDGAIFHVNQAGNALMRHGGALRRTQSRLAARRSDDDKALMASLARVAATQRTELLRLSSRTGSLTLLIAVGPVPGHSLVTVCVADLHTQVQRSIGWTREAFGFSSQNAQLAEALLSGLSLAEFSSTTGVTLGAARTRLKKLFIETGTQSQASLVSVLSRAAALSLNTTDSAN